MFTRASFLSTALLVTCSLVIAQKPNPFARPEAEVLTKVSRWSEKFKDREPYAHVRSARAEEVTAMLRSTRKILRTAEAILFIQSQVDAPDKLVKCRAFSAAFLRLELQNLHRFAEQLDKFAAQEAESPLEKDVLEELAKDLHECHDHITELLKQQL